MNERSSGYSQGFKDGFRAGAARQRECSMREDPVDPVRVADLTPGDRVTKGNQSAVFIACTAHPVWPALDLVIWRLDNGKLSLDALAAEQEVGALADIPGTWERKMRLRAAISGRRT